MRPSLSPSRGQAWFTVGVLTAANVLSYLDRQVLGLLVPPIRADLELTDTQMSLLLGFAFALFYTVFGLPIGRWVDSGTRRLIVPLGITVWSIATAACGLARSFGTLFTSRVFVGVGEAALAPAAFSMISDLFPAERRGKPIAVFTLGPAIGSGIALALAGILFAYFESQDQLAIPLIGAITPWQAVFITVGIPGLLVALIALLLPEPPRVGLRAQEPFPIREVARYTREQAGLLAPLMIGFALMSLKAYGISAWIPTFLMRTHGFSIKEAGISYGLTIAIMSTIGILFGGVIADWLSARGVRAAKINVAITGNLLTLIPIVGYPLVSSSAVSIVLIGFYYLFASLTTPMGVIALQEVTPSRLRGQMSAVFLFVTTLIGLGVGPTVVALITDYVFRDPNDLRYSLAIVPLVTVSLALVLLLRVRKLYPTDLEA